MRLYDVAVIGAGPSGSRVARKLAEAEHDVVVVEKKEKLDAPVCCTGIIGQECVDIFGFESSVIFRQACSAVIFPPSGEPLRIWRQQPQASIVNRPALNLSLAEKAMSAGAEYLLETKAVDIEVNRDRAIITIQRNKESGDILEARAVIIAAGFGTKLADNSCERTGDFVMGVQAEVETSGVEEVEVYFGGETAPGFFAWLTPTSPGHALAGLMTRRNSGEYLRKLISSLGKQGKISETLTDFRYGGVPLKPGGKTFGERILVVGSAAGQIKPITGGGVYYGMLCADIAADCLHRALESDTLSIRDLSEYEKNWKKKLGREIRTGYAARRLYEKLSDRQINRIFGIVRSRGIDKKLMESEDLSFDWHSGVIFKLTGLRALSRFSEKIKIPVARKAVK